MSTKKKILVTGGAGYIGSHTIIELLADGGYTLVSLDNYSNSDAGTYDRIEQITGERIAFYSCDLSDRSALTTVLEKEKDIEGIIHFAAFKSVPESVADPLLYYKNNVVSLVNLLACCREYGIRNFIFSSSCSVYGNIDHLPVNENTPPGKPESPYATTKVMGENILRDFSGSEGGFHAIALRYFNPVGAHISGLNGELPRNRPNNLFPVITQTAAGKNKELVIFGNDYPTRDGTCIRDYVHVSDIARAHVLAMAHLLSGKQAAPYDVINLGTGEGVTVTEALSAFITETGITPTHRFGERRAGDVCAIYSDCTKAKAILGWKPLHDLKDMVASAWKWEQHLSQQS